MPVDITQKGQGPLENLRSMENMFLRAATEKVTVSAILEREDPTDAYPDGSEERKLDAFERAMMAANIVTKSNHARGVYADKFERFYQDEAHRALGLEFMQRLWRAAKYGQDPSTRFLLSSSIQTVSVGARPYIEAASIEAERDAIDIPLRDLIAIENRINANAYRAVVLNETESMLHGSKAVEGAELPRAKIVLSDKETRLQKWGNAVEWTYEAVSQEPIDVIGFFIRQIAIQAEYDKLTDVMDILLNDPDVVTDNLTDLDAAATDQKLTIRALMAESMKFKRGPRMNTLLAQEDNILDFLMTPVGGTSARPLAETNSTPLGPIQRLGGQAAGGFSYASVADAATDKLVFLDRGAAIERISRIGSDISETQKFITRQTEVMTMTEYEQFHVVRPSAVRLVDLTQ